MTHIAWKQVSSDLILFQILYCIVIVQSFSHVWLSETPWTAACQTSLSITNSWSLLKFMSIELVMPSNHVILCCPLLLPFSSCLQSYPTSGSFLMTYSIITILEEEMAGWHHQLNGHEFEQTPGDGEGQRSLACCSPWGCKESDRTQWMNNKI